MEEVFLLVLLDAVLNLFIYVQFKSQDLVFLSYQPVEDPEPFLNVQSLEYLLFL